jgi:hypothetical protein
MWIVRTILPVLLLVSVVPGRVASAAEDRTPNLTVELRLPYAGGTEMTSDGRYVYAGQFNGRTERGELPRQGGVRILDTQVSPPKLVGTISCPGTDMDVAIARTGLLVVAHHRSSCGVPGNGVTLFDVTNPAKPKRLASLAVASAHTLTAVPGTNFVYVSPGGLGNGDGVTTVVDVADPRRPVVAARLRPDDWGCHDVTFGKPLHGPLLGVCTGYSGVRIWDMSEPRKPRVLAFLDRKSNPDLQFAHGAAISPDGGLLVVNDEAFFTHECRNTRTTNFGALHLYDITDPAKPGYLGRILPPRGAAPSSNGFDVRTWCTSHQLNFIPNSRRLVNAWFTGGISVWDLTVPVRPREEAHYMAAGAVTWTAHWFNDRIWVNDMTRGLEVLRLSLLPTGGPVVSPAWTPASAIPPGREPFSLPPGLRFVCPA